MKKFKKSLMINVPEDDHHQAKSPSHMGYKQTKEKSLLLYNEHTITSSANNQDEMLQEDERELVTCEQFVQFHSKDINQKNQHDQHQQQSANKLQRHKKFNVIEFEEFCIEDDKTKDLHQTLRPNHSSVHPYQKMSLKNQRKQFSIEIPEIKIQQKQTSGKLTNDLKNQNTGKTVKQNFPKQPPAPSNKSKLSKTLNRHFVFPTTDEQILHQTLSKKGRETERIGSNLIAEQQHETIVKELNEYWSKKLQVVNKSFQKERQEFYRQKSSLDKDLMIKDGQIEMLQKLITNRYQPKQGNTTNNNYGSLIEKRQSSFKTSLNVEKNKSSLYLSDEKLNAMETILLEKDLKINSLMEKLNELNSLIDRKNDQLQEVKVNLLKIQKMNESLRNEMFIHEKKDQSQKLTKQFFKVKQTLIQVRQSSNTPKGFSRSKWQQEFQVEKQRSRDSQQSDYPLRGIDDLHKRLESLKMNRIELENRGRIKSEIGYPQTSKNRTKGTFDFKGKIYDRDRDYASRGGLY